jgi:hypothetical protein
VAGVMLVSGLYRSCRDPTIFNKASIEGFHCLCRLGPPGVKVSNGCWRSWVLGRSRPPRPGVTVIPGTLADRWLCPWPTQTVIPTTLAPETGEVSWDSMGLRQVLFLAEVGSYPSKCQDLSSGLKVVDLEVKSRGIRLAISGRAGSRTEPARGCSTAASRRLAPQNLSLSKSRPTLLLA